jgi:integrase
MPVPDKRWTVSAYLDYWLSESVADRLRPKTLLGYESVVRVHLAPALGKKRLDQLTAREVRAFLNDRRNTGLSPRMIQIIHAVLRNALQHAVREELITRNVAKLVQVETPRYEVGTGLSVKEARTLLAAARGHRLWALYVLAVTLGLRQGELLGLSWSAVDLDSGELEVRQTLQRVGRELRFQGPKTRHSRRTVPLPDLCLDVLREHKARQAAERLATGPNWQDYDLVFCTTRGTPIEPRNLVRHFYSLRQRAVLPTVRFHDLRHTAVTLLLDLGVPPHVVRAIVGHSDIHVTMTIYAHAALDEQRRALRQLGARLTPER